MALAIISQQNFSVKPSSFHPSLPKIYRKIQPALYTKTLQSHCFLNNLYNSNPIPRTSSIPWNFNHTIKTIGLLMGVIYPDMPSTEALLSSMTSLASQVLLPALIHKYVPPQFQGHVLSTLQSLLDNTSSILTLVIYECNGNSPNQIYEASQMYLRTKISPFAERLRVSKAEKENYISVSMEQDDEIIDVFEDIVLKWKSICLNSQMSNSDTPLWQKPSQYRCFELSFNKKHKEKVLGSYLPYILSKSKYSEKEKNVVKVHTVSFCGSGWKSINLDHPATFDTVVMDPGLKKELMKDLDMFLKRKEFHKSREKVWTRRYLLSGPLGTGKSSLITAMASYLNFDIHRLDLMGIRSESELRSLMLDIGSQSILVVKDINYNVDSHDHKSGSRGHAEDNQLTQSDLLNLMEGPWPCGSKRVIIVFMTNDKDRLDPALLNPGCIDMHIHMSCCTFTGYKLLASNYHKIQQNPLFREIEGLLGEVNVTLAEVCEELTKSNHADTALHALVEFLQRKKMERSAAKDEEWT